MRRMFPHVLSLLVVFVVLAGASAEDSLTSVIHVPASTETLHIAARVPAPASEWVELEELNGETTVRAQILPALTEAGLVDATHVRVAAVIPPSDARVSPRKFRVVELASGMNEAIPTLYWKDLDDRSIRLMDGDMPVLTYNHGVITREDLPLTEKRRERACYIHPLYGLSGEVLTDDFPRDHYHHHGVFWTWPHVGVGGKTYDLWNVGGLHQRFVRFLAREDGPVAGVLGVENEWVVDGRRIMLERVWIRAYATPAEGRCRTVDLEFVFIPVERAVTLQGAEGKSYGGLTVRFRPPSPNDTSNAITVPGGKADGDLPDTPLPWADYTSRFGEGDALSGAAVFIPPTHPDFPPTWLTRYYGPLCVGWPGVKARTFDPEVPIRLHYRLWVHKDAVELHELERAYQAYEAAEQTVLAP